MPEIRLDGEPVTTWIPQPDTVTGMTPTPNPRRDITAGAITSALAGPAIVIAVVLATIQAAADVLWPTPGGHAWWYSAADALIYSLATSACWWIVFVRPRKVGRA